MRCFMKLVVVGWIGLLSLSWGSCWALEPDEVCVLANGNAPHSLALAHYYMKKRNIPAQNLLVLSLPTRERCTRAQYNTQALAPVRAYLHKHDPYGLLIHCLAVMYGVPLIVSPSAPNPTEQAELLKLRGRARQLHFRLKNIRPADKEQSVRLRKRLHEIEGRMAAFRKADQEAAFDSEIALAAAKPYPLDGWLLNPDFVGFRGKHRKNMPDRILMVARLDGPSPKTVRRIIDDSLRVERTGLTGKAYFDARWPDPGQGRLSGYAFYDRSLHLAAREVRRSGLMPVTVDQKQAVFQPGTCPDAALYCGWYSLGHYVDAFQWVPGAVGYHIASIECHTLHRKDSQLWCKMMLQKGVAATVGPVSEPYVQAFPVPAVFFGALLQGRLTLAECYTISHPFCSWKMVLIGDPLYNPFKKFAASRAAGGLEPDHEHPDTGFQMARGRGDR